MKKEIDTFVPSLLENGQQISQRSSKSVHRPRRDQIELLGIHCLHHRVKSGALVAALGTADAGVFVDFPNLPSRPIRHRTQFAQLVFGVLFDVLTRT
jgi:hypothetical protein